VAILDSNPYLNSALQVFDVAIFDSNELPVAMLDSNVAMLDSKSVV
jgi:hypothetical protein